jgi:hypothetical protein
MYKYGTLKPVEVILRRGRERGGIMKGMIQTEVKMSQFLNKTNTY